MKNKIYEASTVEVFKKGRGAPQFYVRSSFPVACSCGGREADPGHPGTAIHRKGCAWLGAQPDWYFNHGYPGGKP